MPSPDEQRRFALQVVRRLRTAGFEAYWAGGCVRDHLLRRVPKDYDVATNATPAQIRDVFGRQQTLAIGAAFGVITVLGPQRAGMVEVATFRRDAAYSDGRHPDHVTFSSPENDAARRDFTINGMFFDPLEERVIDFVGGQLDLQQGVIRAIGDPRERFAEDKLRLLRAVRFAATFGFALEADTLAAIAAMAGEIVVVSAERIAAEMRRMLIDPHRAEAVGLLLASGLAAVVLPEIVPADAARQQRLEHTLAMLARLDQPGFPLALAALLHKMIDAAAATKVCRRWRLSNSETDRVAWLAAQQHALDTARSLRWSELQPLLIAAGIGDLLALIEADVPGAPEAAYCRELLGQPPELLNPPPLLSGDDLYEHGVPTGPQYRLLLQRVRAAQLDKEISSKQEALALVDRLRS